VIGFIDMMRSRGDRVESVCAVLRGYGVRIAARSYRAAKSRPPSARAVADEALAAKTRELRETPDAGGRLPRERFYGRRKMTRLLARCGVLVSEGRIGRLMRAHGMFGPVRGRRKITTVSKGKPAGADLLGRDFTAGCPDSRWVTDITYVKAGPAWAYTAFMTDLYARVIVAWEVLPNMTTRLVSGLLQAALWSRRRQGHPVADGLVHHSDHGSQYTSIAYGEQLALAGIVPSSGSKGDAYDNALA
jgi:transposase InsO family protein